jgi:septal ring factor EnvC (AmiA/AmiB activator)
MSSFPAMPPPRPMMPRTYSAAAASPAEQHVIARSDMMVAMEQHWVQCERRIQVKIQEQIQQITKQQEQRIIQAEQTTKQLSETTAQLADKVNDLSKKNEETDAKLDRIMEQEERIVGRLSMEFRESISSILSGRGNE